MSGGLRVGIIGASGTGKTRLATWIAERWRLPLCPVGSRQIAKQMGFNNPYDVDVAGMRPAFQRRLFLEKRAWERDHESFVSDRTCFDNLAYATQHGARMEMAEVAEYYEAMDRYTHVVYLPVSAFQELGTDPHRVRERGYHHMFDIIVQGLLEDLETATPRLLHCGCPLEGRQERVAEFLPQAP